MRILARKQFLRHCPGPFAYLAGRDGVDNTFDVCCLTTENYIVSTYYWGEREAAEATAAAVVAALNVLAGHSLVVPPGANRLIYGFTAAHPGPFAARRGACPGSGPYVEVYCRTSGEPVVVCYHSGNATAASYTAHAIARALNRLRHNRTN